MLNVFTDKNGTHFQKVGDRYRKILTDEIFDSIDTPKEWVMNPNFSDGKDVWEHPLEKANNRHIHSGK